ncbi:MAG TPA: alpha/beta-hydrolase family protein [Acidimicrobiia bacterium]
MLPRPWQVQGVISGLAVALGYGAGSALLGFWRRWLGSHPIGRGLQVTAFALAAALVVWVLVVHGLWRLDIAALMDVDLPLFPYLPLVLASVVVVAFLLIQLGRGIRALLGWCRRLLARWVPDWLATGVTSVVALVLVVLFFDMVVAGQLVPALEKAHRTSDQRFEPGVAPPTSEFLAGGPGSMIEWETMGSQGRNFVAQAPTESQLEDFSGVRALQPIRIYVGLAAANDAQARAALAVEEMERTGAFDRDVVVLIAPTGSGWIDPYAIDGIEYMHNGDTAAVAIQYSYLASWMVMIGNQDLAMDAAGSLLTAVTERINREPEGDRPRILIYGESLGAFGWERLFEDLDDLTSAVDGVLWVGPPRSGPLWKQLASDRDPGSPLWRPVYRGGETVRFGADGDDLAAPEGEWEPPRLVYLQHASDPITWWTTELIFNRPEWLDDRGPDISGHMPYLPVITYWQMAVDLAVGTNAPIGHGHKFGSAQTEAWALIYPPAGWTSAETKRLIAALDG